MEIDRNIGSISLAEAELLKKVRVIVIGCGGSGYLIDMLSRLGVGTLGVVDGDKFEQSNINRQLICNGNTISEDKVLATKEYVENINPNIVVETYPFFVEKIQDMSIINQYDYVFDCTDNIEAKRIVQEACNMYNKPLIFGGMSKWICFVGISLPNQNVVNRILGKHSDQDISQEEKKSKSSSTAAINAVLSSLYVSAFLNNLFSWNKWNRVFVLNLKDMKVAHFNPMRKGLLLFKKW